MRKRIRGNVTAMGAVLVPVILALVVVVLGVIAMKRFSREEIQQSDRLQNADRPTLRYQIPPGQDPALVLNALHRAGYDASPDSEPVPSSPIVIIGESDGDEPDREAVRATLVQVDGSNINPEDSGAVERGRVLFADEKPGGLR
jgi:hypothetical protein